MKLEFRPIRLQIPRDAVDMTDPLVLLTDDRKKARESVDKYIADAKKEAPSEESFHRQLRALGLTPEKFQAKMMERAIAEEVFIR